MFKKLRAAWLFHNAQKKAWVGDTTSALLILSECKKLAGERFSGPYILDFAIRAKASGGLEVVDHFKATAQHVQNNRTLSEATRNFMIYYMITQTRSELLPYLSHFKAYDPAASGFDGVSKGSRNVFMYVPPTPAMSELLIQSP